MADKPKIIAFAGSKRSGSYNQLLLENAAAVARDAGGEVTVVQLKDYPLPIIDEDLEAAQGIPQAALDLKQMFSDHSGMLIACPEYNSSITPLLKNTIDWLSRRASDDDPPLSAFRGKTAALLAASPGGFGGLRGLRHVREILSNIGVIVSPSQFALAKSHERFDENGQLNDDRHVAMLRSCVEQFIQLTRGQELASHQG